MLQELIKIIYRYHIVAPANIIMLGKTLALLEGTGRLLDPDFDLWALAHPITGKSWSGDIRRTRYAAQRAACLS